MPPGEPLSMPPICIAYAWPLNENDLIHNLKYIMYRIVDEGGLSHGNRYRNFGEV